jgi:hypothetical protein
MESEYKIFYLGSRRDRQTRRDPWQNRSPELRALIAANVQEMRQVMETPMAKSDKRQKNDKAQMKEKKNKKTKKVDAKPKTVEEALTQSRQLYRDGD